MTIATSSSETSMCYSICQWRELVPSQKWWLHWLLYEQWEKTPIYISYIDIQISDMYTYPIGYIIAICISYIDMYIYSNLYIYIYIRIYPGLPRAIEKGRGSSSKFQEVNGTGNNCYSSLLKPWPSRKFVSLPSYKFGDFPQLCYMFYQRESGHPNLGVYGWYEWHIYSIHEVYKPINITFGGYHLVRI